MTIQRGTRPLFFKAENIGDYTVYYVSLADWYDSIYVACGGQYPSVGGLINNDLLDELGNNIIEWAQGKKEESFIAWITNWHAFGHFLERQSVNAHKWDVVAALVFAWLHRLEKADSEPALHILGHLYHDKRDNAHELLGKTLQILY